MCSSLKIVELFQTSYLCVKGLKEVREMGYSNPVNGDIIVTNKQIHWQSTFGQRKLAGLK